MNKSLIKIAIALCLALVLMGCNTENESDFTAPSVVYTYPSNGETNVSVDTDIIVYFNEEISPYTATSSTFTLSRMGAYSKLINGTVSVSGIMVTLSPDAPLEPNTTFVATVSSSLTDTNGNGIPLGYSFYFTTGALVNGIASFAPAIMVTGQTDFTSGNSNMGGAPSQYSMSAPSGNPYAYSTGMLMLPDTGNNRILGYSYFPSSNGYPADFVYGQYDFVSNSPGLDSWRLSSPGGYFLDEATGWSALTDSGNNRVFIWSWFPYSLSLPSYVLGQADFYSNVPYCSQYHLNNPSAAVVMDDQVIVADTANNRVLIWSAIPTYNSEGASIVLGQAGFDICTAAPSTGPSTLNAPTSVWSDGNILIVADSGNNRVLIWTTFPTTNGEPADIVVGQPNMYTAFPLTSSVDMNNPTAVTSDGKKLIVADTGNSRVLIWHSMPDMNHESANVVLGQASFLSSTPNDDNFDNVQDANPTARTLFAPSGLLTFYGYLIVADTGNNRYLTYYIGY